MLYKVFDFADKEVARGDGAAARGRRDLGRPAARGVPRGRDRLAVHALSGLSRVARRDRRHPARPRPVLGALRPGHRERHDRGVPSRAVPRPRDEGPRRAAGRVPADEPAHGDRRRRVRRDAGHRHARGPARGDRRRDRRRVRPARTSRSSGSTTTRSASTARSRSTTSTSSSRPRSRRRTTTRSAASSSACSAARPRRATRSTSTACASRSPRSRARASSSSTVEFPPRPAEEELAAEGERLRSYTRRTLTRPLPTAFAEPTAPPAWPRPRGFPRPERLERGVRLCSRRRALRWRRSSPSSACARSATCFRHRPFRYEAAAPEVPIADLLAGEEEVAIAGEVVRTSVRRPRRRLAIVQARIADDSGEVTAVWFNQVWLAEKLKPGTHVRLRGQLRSQRVHRPLLRPERRLCNGRFRAGLPGERGGDRQEAPGARRQGAPARPRLRRLRPR